MNPIDEETEAELPSARHLLRVGLTGGIGSGKSTVSRVFAQLGRKVLSADDIARKLTKTNAGIKAEIRATFGDDVFLDDGALDRKALADIVFNDGAAKEKLNAIVHPLVFEEIERQVAALTSDESAPYIIIEAALVYESRMDDDLDYVIVVDAKEETRIARVIKRDRLTREEVLARMKSQMEVSEKVELADFVVQNDGTEAELIERVSFIDKLLIMMSSTRPAVPRE